ncbi:MAG: hypothetical protein ABR534_06490 [Desulfotignum sp.]|nr:hypothetical protein [Desulfobacteraceae bacterium]
MYWVTVTILGMAHYFFHKGGGPGTFSTKKLPAGDQESSQKDADQHMPHHDKKEDSTNNRENRGGGDQDGKKSLETASDPWERHLLYLQKIESAYRGRRKSMDDRSTAIALSRQYLSEFPDLRQAVFDNMADQDPKVISVFKMLAIMLEEDGAYGQAVTVCRTALANGLEDGTKTGFEGRIKRILKKKESPE